MADNVGDGLTQRERQGRLLLGTEGFAVWFSFSNERDAGGIQGAARSVDFSCQAAGSVAANGFADFCESGSGGSFDIAHFRSGAGGIERYKASSEFCLENDHRKSMAEDIVQIAGYAFALGDGCEG